MEFSKIVTHQVSDGKEVTYGVVLPHKVRVRNRIFMLKVGFEGTLRGYKDKYVRIVNDIARCYGVVSVIASNPNLWEDKHDRGRIECDIEFAKSLAQECFKSQSANDLDLYYMAYSNSAETALRHAWNYPEIKRLAVLNSQMTDMDAVAEGVQKLRRDLPVYVIYGALDPAVREGSNLLKRDLSAEQRHEFIVPGADHNFDGYLEMFIRTSKAIFDVDILKGSVAQEVMSPKPKVDVLGEYRKKRYLGMLMLHASVHRGHVPQVMRCREFLKKTLESSDFCIVMPADVLPKAVDEDRIRSSIETGRCSTSGGNEVRREWMERFYGVDPKTLSPADYPKFGMLVGKNHLQDMIRDTTPFYQYGCILLTLRKERLMDRTTMCVGSSVNFFESRLKAPSFVNDPQPICIKGYPTSPDYHPAEFFDGLLLLDNLISKGLIKPEAPNDLANATEGMIGFECFELQIFGDLTFSADVSKVEYFVLSDDEPEIVESLRPKLEGMGIEVGSLLPQYGF